MKSRRNFLRILSQLYVLPAGAVLAACANNKRDIKIPKLKLLPFSGDVYEGEPFTVKWEAENIERIILKVISADGSPIYQTQVVAGILSFMITDFILKGQYKIRLSQKENDTIYSESPLFNVLTRKAHLTIKIPNGGEDFSLQQNISIEWEATKVSTVNLYYSFNKGLTWLKVVSGVNALAGSYQWKLPDINSKDYLIKIEDAQDKTVFDSSDNVFQVVARYTIDLNLYPELSVIGTYRVFESNVIGNYTLIRVSETSFKAYSHICTHNGCTIALLASKKYHCSCHGSEFDFEGNVTNGPAMRPLDLLNAVFNITDNVVVVTK